MFKGLVNLQNIFKTLHDLNDIYEKTKMLKPHLKIPTESKVMQVSKLCKLSYKPRPHYCFEMIFSKCHILCSVISTVIKLIYAHVVFYHIE